MGYNNFQLTEAEVDRIKAKNARKAIRAYIKQHGSEPNDISSFYTATNAELEHYRRVIYAEQMTSGDELTPYAIESIVTHVYNKTYVGTHSDFNGTATIKYVDNTVHVKFNIPGSELFDPTISGGEWDGGEIDDDDKWVFDFKFNEGSNLVQITDGVHTWSISAIIDSTVLEAETYKPLRFKFNDGSYENFDVSTYSEYFFADSLIFEPNEVFQGRIEFDESLVSSANPVVTSVEERIIHENPHAQDGGIVFNQGGYDLYGKFQDGEDWNASWDLTFTFADGSAYHILIYFQYGGN